MSGYTGPTGPTGIAGIYGPQGVVGTQGARGNRGPLADGGSPTMQYQSFSVIGETGVTTGVGTYGLRPVFDNAKPPMGLSHINGMQIVDTYTLTVPKGTYSIQAASVGVQYTGGFGRTSVLAIGDTNVTTSCLLAGTPNYEDSSPLGLDGVITFNSTTNVELRHYSSVSVGQFSVQTRDDTNTSWSCFISFMKIQ